MEKNVGNGLLKNGGSQGCTTQTTLKTGWIYIVGGTVSLDSYTVVYNIVLHAA